MKSIERKSNDEKSSSYNSCRSRDRWETEQELLLLEGVYDHLRPYINFFQPSFKLIAKERIGNKTVKRYDTAKTPY